MDPELIEMFEDIDPTDLPEEVAIDILMHSGMGLELSTQLFEDEKISPDTLLPIIHFIFFAKKKDAVDAAAEINEDIEHHHIWLRYSEEEAASDDPLPWMLIILQHGTVEACTSEITLRDIMLPTAARGGVYDAFSYSIDDREPEKAWQAEEGDIELH